MDTFIGKARIFAPGAFINAVPFSGLAFKGGEVWGGEVKAKPLPRKSLSQLVRKWFILVHF